MFVVCVFIFWYFFFFFSSRRRHTRCLSDWSSDVCSSDLDLPFVMPPVMPGVAGLSLVLQGYVPFSLSNPATLPLDLPYFLAGGVQTITEIGRASCRERV